jgi:regulator of replication initiation timing
MTNDWILILEEVKDHVRKLFTENEELKKENRELRSQRDYLQQMVDQTIGRG